MAVWGTDYNIQLILEAQDNASKTLNSISDKVSGIWKTVAGLAISSKLVSWLKTVAWSVLELWWNLEQAQIAFSTMLGSAEKAQTLLEDLSDFAKSTPFELTWIRDSAKQLLAYWIEADKMIPTLKALWDVSAGLWVEIWRLALPFGQVRTAWKLTSNDLKQFINAWVPLITELAQNLWVAESEIASMVSAGKIWFADVENAFITMTSAWGKFADLMNSQSWTFQWILSNMQDSFDWIKESLWMAVLPMLERLLNYVAPIIANIADWVNNNQELATTLSLIVAWAITLIWTLTGLWAILPLISAWISLLTWPIWIVTVALWALAVAWFYNWWWIQEKTKSTIDFLRPYISAFTDWFMETWNYAMTVTADTLVVWFDTIKLWIQAFKAIWSWDWEEVKNIAIDVAYEIDGLLTDAFWDMRTNIKNWFMEWYNWIVDKLSSLMNLISWIVDWIRNAWSNVRSSVSSFVEAWTSKARSLIKALSWEKATWWIVNKWETYLVWEKWPELFTPAVSWRITPNNQITNNNWVTVNISWVSVRDDNDIERITDEIIRKIKLEKNFWIA